MRGLFSRLRSALGEIAIDTLVSLAELTGNKVPRSRRKPRAERTVGEWIFEVVVIVVCAGLIYVVAINALSGLG